MTKRVPGAEWQFARGAKKGRYAEERPESILWKLSSLRGWKCC